nr:hypothetical protein [uncultured bacterium]
MKNNSPLSRWWLKSALVAVIILGLGIWLAPYWQGIKPISPIMLQIGNFPIHWYGVILAIATGSGFWLTMRLSRGRVTVEQILEASIWMIVGGLIGARLLFVMLKWPIYSLHPEEILLFNQGGLSIHGALLGGIGSLLWYASKAKLNFWQLADLSVPGLALGQAIGRFGNFFNQEAFGGPTQLPWKMYVAPSLRPIQLLQERYFHPTFIYESILDIALLIVLLRMTLHPKRAGSILAWYLILYSGLRFGVEWFRVDSDSIGIFTLAQWASLAIIVVGLYLLNRKSHA